MNTTSRANGKPHIADIDFGDFYRSAFATKEEARRFVEAIEELPGHQNEPKIVLHQTARMLWLADRIDAVAGHRPAFQILFYLIAAELVAKIAFGFQGEGFSREHVSKFFSEICSDTHRQRLGRAFHHVVGGEYLSPNDSVDLLYTVRCDVVHRGMYFAFHLKQRTDRGVPFLIGHAHGDLVADIEIEEIRQIVLEGAILACRKLLQGLGISAP